MYSIKCEKRCWNGLSMWCFRLGGRALYIGSLFCPIIALTAVLLQVIFFFNDFSNYLREKVAIFFLLEGGWGYRQSVGIAMALAWRGL